MNFAQVMFEFKNEQRYGGTIILVVIGLVVLFWILDKKK